MFSASRQGAIAYHPGQDVIQLVWADQHGNELGVVGSPGDYESSPHGSPQTAPPCWFSRQQPGLGTFDIFRIDLVRQTEERLTAERGRRGDTDLDRRGRGIVFAADRGGVVPYLFRKDLASGKEQALLPQACSSSRWTSFQMGRRWPTSSAPTRALFDIFQVSSSSGAEPIPLVVSRADKNDMRLSPDGRAMAFIAFDGTRTDL